MDVDKRKNHPKGSRCISRTSERELLRLCALICANAHSAASTRSEAIQLLDGALGCLEHEECPAYSFCSRRNAYAKKYLRPVTLAEAKDLSPLSERGSAKLECESCTQCTLEFNAVAFDGECPAKCKIDPGTARCGAYSEKTRVLKIHMFWDHSGTCGDQMLHNCK